MIYALLSLVFDKTLFVVIIIANRMLEGWAFGLIQGMVYGVSSQELPPKEFDRYARTCSACAGLGACMSLLIGPFLFSLGGYFLPYFVLSGFFIVLSFIINTSKVLDEESETQHDYEDLALNFKDEKNPLEQNEININLKFVFNIPVRKLICII